MRRTNYTTLFPVALALAGTLGLAGCDLDVPDLNDPGIDELVEDPTPSKVSAACTGLLIGTRAQTSAGNGYVAQLGILGREAYNFDAADPRFVGELLGGPLQAGSPFGGNFWAFPYANIRLGNIILTAIDEVPEFSDAQRAGIRGFTHTIMAMDLYRVITTRDTVGAVIDTNREIDDLGPIVDRDAVYDEIARLLDEAEEELAAAGEEPFAFNLSNGFSDFITLPERIFRPVKFLTFNRALRARIAVFMEEYDVALDALDDSFLDDTADLDLGAYHSFSTGTGDQQNGLTNVNIFAHPSLEEDAQSNGAAIDERFSRKVVRVGEDDAGGALGLESDLKFTPLYTGPTAPVPIIRNEELILLRAEANWGNGDLAAAIADIDLIRTTSGGLLPYDGPVEEEAVLDELLYNRRYSLMFEGGFRWIDARRFDRVDELPLDQEGHVHNIRYPLPSAECDGRPDESACDLGSQ